MINCFKILGAVSSNVAWKFDGFVRSLACMLITSSIAHWDFSYSLWFQREISSSEFDFLELNTWTHFVRVNDQHSLWSHYTVCKLNPNVDEQFIGLLFFVCRNWKIQNLWQTLDAPSIQPSVLIQPALIWASSRMVSFVRSSYQGNMHLSRSYNSI